MPSPKVQCDCVRCYEKGKTWVQRKTWVEHQNLIQAGDLERHVDGEEADDEEGDDSEGEGDEGDPEDEGDEGDDEEEDEEEYEGQHAIEDEDWDADGLSPEFQFAAQVVAEVAKGTSQKSAGNMLKIMHQYVKERLPEGVNFPKTWYLCEKLGRSYGTSCTNAHRTTLTHTCTNSCNTEIWSDRMPYGK
jgi:hypothetical protein